MTWVKLDDGFFRHRKVVDLSKDGKLLFLAGLCYAAEQLTDGRLSRGAIRTAAFYADVPEETAKELVESGLWHADGEDVLIGSYLDFNPTAEEAHARREARSEAGRRGGVNSGRARRERSKRSKNEANGEANAQAKPKQTGKQTGKQSRSKNEPRTRTRTPSAFASSSEEPSSSSSRGEEEEETSTTTQKAARLIAERRLARASNRAKIVDREKWLKTTTANVLATIGSAILDADPKLTAEELADKLEPDETKPKPRKKPEPCSTCGGSTWLDEPDENGAAVPCPTCKKETHR